MSFVVLLLCCLVLYVLILMYAGFVGCVYIVWMFCGFGLVWAFGVLIFCFVFMCFLCVLGLCVIVGGGVGL